MLHGLAGLVLIAKDSQTQVNRWKDGAYFNFYIVSQEASEGDTAKLHRYKASMYVKSKDIKAWELKIVPGAMFLLTNGDLAAEVKEGFDYTTPQIRINSYNFNVIKKKIEIESKKNEEET